MRRDFLLIGILIVLAALTAPWQASAQLGKRVSIRAGTPEDKALTAINNATDPAQKLALLDQFLADFGQTDMALVAYELYVAHFLAAKDYDKSIEYGEQALAHDPENFNAGVSLLRAAQEKGDTSRLFDYGERIGAILARFRARAAPEGADAALWEREKSSALADAQDNVTYVQYTLFSTAAQTKDSLGRAALLERFWAAFPDSPYAANAATVAADSYRQARNLPKMTELAQKVLSHDPNHVGLLILLADHWAESREQLDKAEEYARKALDILSQAQKPEQMSEEDWQKQKSLQQGLGHSLVGQVQVLKNHDAQALDSFKAAVPLLKPYNFYYGRCLYLWGFALARMKRHAEARPILSEAAGVDSPYKSLAQDTLSKIGRPARKAPAKKRP